MNKYNKRELKQNLLELREKAANRLDENAREKGEYYASLKDTTSELSSYDNHPGDLGSELYDLERDSTLINASKQLLREIDEALERFDNGEYGKCVSCHKEIIKDRLESIPYTQFCYECAKSQEENEHNDEHPYFEGKSHLEQISGTDSDQNFIDKEDTWEKLKGYGYAGEIHDDYDNEDDGYGSVDYMDQYSIESRDLSTNPEVDPLRFRRKRRRLRKREN